VIFINLKIHKNIWPIIAPKGVIEIKKVKTQAIVRSSIAIQGSWPAISNIAQIITQTEEHLNHQRLKSCHTMFSCSGIKLMLPSETSQ